MSEECYKVYPQQYKTGGLIIISIIKYFICKNEHKKSDKEIKILKQELKKLTSNQNKYIAMDNNVPKTNCSWTTSNDSCKCRACELLKKCTNGGSPVPVKMLLALMQSGKSGTYIYVIVECIRLKLFDYGLIVTGVSDVCLIQQIKNNLENAKKSIKLEKYVPNRTHCDAELIFDGEIFHDCCEESKEEKIDGVTLEERYNDLIEKAENYDITYETFSDKITKLIKCPNFDHKKYDIGDAFRLSKNLSDYENLKNREPTFDGLEVLKPSKLKDYKIKKNTIIFWDE